MSNKNANDKKGLIATVFAIILIGITVAIVVLLLNRNQDTSDQDTSDQNTFDQNTFDSTAYEFVFIAEDDQINIGIRKQIGEAFIIGFSPCESLGSAREEHMRLPFVICGALVVFAVNRDIIVKKAKQC